MILFYFTLPIELDRLSSCHPDNNFKSNQKWRWVEKPEWVFTDHLSGTLCVFAHSVDFAQLHKSVDVKRI